MKTKKTNLMPEITNLPAVPSVEGILKRIECTKCESFYVSAYKLKEVRESLSVFGVELSDMSDLKYKICSTEMREKISKLCVPGVAEIVDIFTIKIELSDRNIVASVEGAYPVLIIDNRAYSVPAWPSDNANKTYSLSLFSLSYAANAYRIATAEGWKFNKPAPKKIGKANAKKIAEWVEYLDRREAAANEYLNRGEAAERDLIKRLDASGVSYEKEGKFIKIRNGVLACVIEFSPSGFYSVRQPFLDLSQCGGSSDDNVLNLMLNTSKNPIF